MPVNADAVLNEADWVKSSWDQLNVNSVEELRALLKRLRMSVSQFKRLPVYKRNKDRLAFLREL